jgi:monovalent cation/hydrogen antiporter
VLPLAWLRVPPDVVFYVVAAAAAVCRGVILGAVVAPTDAIAATAIATRIGLPRRIADLLEGETLVNDATGLLALEFGLALAMGNESPTIAAGARIAGHLTI